MAGPWKTLYVFVSSTFRDMHAERDHLVRVVFPELAERLAARQVHLRAVDLRWGVLAEEDSLQVCLDVLRDSQPFFLGLLGGRYGSLPGPPAVLDRDSHDRVLGAGALDPSDQAVLGSCYRWDEWKEHWALNPGLGPDRLEHARATLARAGMTELNHSITALEIFRGVLDPPAGRPMTSLFYLRDPSATAAIPAPDRDDYLESDPDRIARLDELKQQLAPFGPTTYPARWDPAARRFSGLEPFGRMVMDDLWRAVEEHLPHLPDEPGDTLASERSFHETLMESRAEHFEGRNQERLELWQFVRHRLEGRAAVGLLAVTGASGTGKTALLAAFARAYGAAHPDHPMVTHFVGASPASASPSRMLARLWEEIGMAAGLDESPPSSHREMVEALPGFLERASERSGLVLVVDGVNQLEPGPDTSPLGWLPDRLPPRCAVIAGVLEGSEAAQALLARRPAPRVMTLGSLDPDESRQLVAGYLDRQHRRLGEEHTELLIGKPDGGRPLYLIAALEELLAVGRYETLGAQIGALPGTLESLLQDVLARHEGDHGAALVTDFLSLMAVGRGGQEEEDLRVMLAEPGAPAVPPLVWDRMFRALGFYLHRRGGRVAFYHDQLRLAVDERYLSPPERARYHRRTADHLASRGLEYPPAIADLPWHLSAAGEADRLWALLDDPEFRSRKVMAAGTVHPLTEDLGLGLDAARRLDSLPALARMGFHLCDCREGGFGPVDLIGLHSRDPQGAVRDARLLGEANRFRALILLAWLEAGAGRRIPAEDLLSEALGLEGVRLGEAEVEWLAVAAGTLVEAGCAGAARLLGRGLEPLSAIGPAVRALARFPERVRAILLASAVEALRNGALVVGHATQLLEGFEAVTDAVAGLDDKARRDPLFDELEWIQGSARTLADDATRDQDPMMQAIAHLVGSSSLTDDTGGAQGVSEALGVRLGVSRLLAGDERRGVAMIERGIQAGGRRDLSPGVIQAMARAILQLGAPWRRKLFESLVTAATARQPGMALLALLQELREAPPGPDLIECVAPVLARVGSLPVRVRGAMSLVLAQAQARAGAAGAARREARILMVPRIFSFLLRRNPMIEPGRRIGLVLQQCDAALVVGARGSGWVDRSLRWALRRSPTVSSERERADLLIRLARLAGAFGLPDRLLKVTAAALTVGDAKIRRRALAGCLQAIGALPPEARLPLRARVFDTLVTGPADAATVAGLNAWMADAGPSELQQLHLAGQTLNQVGDAALRSQGWATIAATRARLGDETGARTALQAVVLAEQTVATRAVRFAARTAWAATADNPQAWQEVIHAISGPDPELGADLIGIAAARCDAKRLRELERAGFLLPGIPGLQQHRLRALCAVADGWSRLGYGTRSARTLLAAVRAHGVRWLTTHQLDRVLGTLATLGAHPARVAVLRELFRKAETADPVDVSAVYRRLAPAAASLPGRGPRQSAMRRLSSLALAQLSSWRWRGVEAVGSVARALALQGEVGPAADLLERHLQPALAGSAPADQEMLQPEASCSARAAVAEVCAALALRDPVHATEWRRRAEETALDTLTAAAEASRGKLTQEAGVASARAWAAVASLGARQGEIVLGPARELVVERARAGDAAFGSRWDGVVALARETAAAGEMTAALELADAITKEQTRDDLLVALGRLTATKGGDPVDLIWRATRDPGTRGRLARAIAEAAFEPRQATRDGVGLGIRLPSKRTWALHSVLRTVGGALFVLGAGVALVWAGWQLLLLEAFRPWSLWIAGVGLAAGGWWTGQDLRRGVFPRWLRRLWFPAGFLLLPILGGLKLLDQWSLVRRWLTRVGRDLRVRARIRRRTRPWTWSDPPPGMLDLIRKAAGESAAFDTLLGSWLSHTGETVASADLPPLAVPSEPPPDVATAWNTWRELSRERARNPRWRRQLRKVTGRIGRMVTAGITAPVAAVLAARAARRTRRAHEVAMAGGKLVESDPAKAIPLLTEACRLAPDQPHYWHDLGVALHEARRYDESVTAKRRATELGVGDPQEGEFWYSLGYTCWMSGRNAEAIPAFERAVALNPPGSLFHEQARQGIDFCRSNLGLDRPGGEW